MFPWSSRTPVCQTLYRSLSKTCAKSRKRQQPLNSRRLSNLPVGLVAAHYSTHVLSLTAKNKLLTAYALSSQAQTYPNSCAKPLRWLLNMLHDLEHLIPWELWNYSTVRSCRVLSINSTTLTWVAVKELNPGYYTGETLLFTTQICNHYSN